MSLSRFAAVKYAALAALCAFQPKVVSASPGNFQPNCDMRSLALSSSQQEQLRQIRIEHRKNMEEARRKDRSENASRKQHLVQQVLSSNPFNRKEARRYLQKRYDSDMDLAIEELAVQHKIYHVLNPEQQEAWVANCAR